MNDETVYPETTLEAEFDAATARLEPSGSASSTTERFFQASIGAMATACDTAEEQFNRFADRGQRVQEEWQDRANGVRQRNAGARNRMRDYFRGAMDMVLDTFNVPSRTDVDTVNVKLNILTRKIDDLQMQSMERPKGATTQVPPLDPPITGDLTT
jgi:polyhydroxyalkanoate synthesis regulator phasin